MILSLTNVTKEYDLDGRTIVTPVRDANLEVSRGEFVLIVGRSGSGKTTLLNLAGGLVKPTSGQVCIKDEDISGMNDRGLSVLRTQTIGFVFQFPSLLPSLSVFENVLMPSAFSRPESTRTIRARAQDLLGRLGLADRLGAYPRQLSAGEQKRAVIARALMNQPQVLLADEPTADLDADTEREIMGLLRNTHANGMTVLMVTHSLELIAHATRTLEMHSGVLVDLTPSG